MAKKEIPKLQKKSTITKTKSKTATEELKPATKKLKPAKSTQEKSIPKKTVSKKAPEQKASTTSKTPATKATPPATKATPPASKATPPASKATPPIEKKPAAKKDTEETPEVSQTIASKTSDKPVPKARIEKAQLEFKIGDFVFYPGEGVGQIVEIEERSFQGEKLLYYVVEFTSLTMRSRFPVNKIDILQVRSVVSPSTARKVLDFLLEPLDTESVTWKDRLQIQHDIIKSGEVSKGAQMLAALYVRRQKKPLSFQERQSYDFALEALRDELSVVLLKDKQEMQEKILSILKVFDVEPVSSKKKKLLAGADALDSTDDENKEPTPRRRRKKNGPEGGPNLEETEIVSMNTLDDDLDEESNEKDWM